MHPKFQAFIEKISTSQQDITDSLQRIFSHTWLAWVDHQWNTKKIEDPTNAEHCIMVGNTQGKNPLTYVEYNPQTTERIIRQVGMLPHQRKRSLIKNTLVGEEKVGQPIITQEASEIFSFLNELHEQVDLRSQHTNSDFQELDYVPSSKRKIDTALLQALLNEQAPDHVSPANNDEPTTEEDINLLEQTPPTRFENLFAYAAHVDQTPAHPAIDIRLLITQSHPALTEASLTEREIQALQVASNMLYQEVVQASSKQLLPPVKEMISLFTQDKARNHVISVFLSVFVEKIHELSLVESK